MCFWVICAMITLQFPVISYAADPKPTPSPTPNPSPNPSPYQLIINKPEQLPSKYREQITQEFYRVYPLLVDKFNKNAPKTVYLKVDNKTEYGAYVMGHTISINYKAIQVDLDAGNLGVMIHELTHIVQHGYQGDVPSWIVEGMADYAVLLFGTEKTDVSLPKASEVKSGKKYLEKESYRHVTRFLLWVKTHKRATIFEDINSAAMTGTYKEELFKKWTGQTLEQLTQSYYKNPGSFENNPQCYAKSNNCVDMSHEQVDTLPAYEVKKPVKLRKMPRKNANITANIKYKNSVVNVQCKTKGDKVVDGLKKTKTWLYVKEDSNTKGYVSSIYININKSKLKEIPQCKKKI
jgi:hypothetical protein